MPVENTSVIMRDVPVADTNGAEQARRKAAAAFNFSQKAGAAEQPAYTKKAHNEIRSWVANIVELRKAQLGRKLTVYADMEVIDLVVEALWGLSPEGGVAVADTANHAVAPKIAAAIQYLNDEINPRNVTQLPAQLGPIVIGGEQSSVEETTSQP